MKNLFFLLSAILIIGFISCKSELTEDNNRLDTSIDHSRDSGCDELLGLDQVPIYPNEFEIEELLANPEDPSDQDINYLLYTLSEAVQPLINDCNFNSVIIEMANASPLNAASLLDLEEQAPLYYNIINENLPAELSIKRIASQMIYRSPFGSAEEHYDPGIFIPNLEIASLERQPLLSAQLGYKGDENHLDDAVLATYYDEQGAINNTWIGEYILDVCTNPIFVIDLLEQSDKTTPPSGDITSDVNAPLSEIETCPDEYTFTNYSIAHRYENNKYSEYYYAVIFYPDSGPRQYGGGSLIKQIHKNSINQTQYNPCLISQMCPNYSNTVRMAIVTFERDAWNTPKTVWFDGNPFHLNMKYSSEWYQKIVFDVDGSDYSVYTKGHVGLESSAICDDCPPGYSFDGAHCHSGMGAPPGYYPFIWGSSFYTTPNCGISNANNCCPAGFGWDTANCHSGISIPAGWQPFIWNGEFYVHPKCL